MSLEEAIVFFAAFAFFFARFLREQDTADEPPGAATSGDAPPVRSGCDRSP
jgi:hypothetical protein